METINPAPLPLPYDRIMPLLAEHGYIADEGLCAAIFVALSLDRPLLVEGAAGVGKTQIAKTMAQALGRPLVRLQCHVGIDETRALYEWNYQKQLLAIQAHAGGREREDGDTHGISNPDRASEAVMGGGRERVDGDAREGQPDIMQSIFTEGFLLERPLLRSIRCEEPAVLLVDELDKADEEFEAFLLELLAEHQVTIPELGTLRASSRPFTVLTSNNARPLSDALRRRCAYAWIGYPSMEKELAILRARFPGVSERLARDVAEAVAALRQRQRILKKPSIAESLDWLAALDALGEKRLTRDAAEKTVSAVLKSHADAQDALEAFHALDGHES